MIAEKSEAVINLATAASVVINQRNLPEILAWSLIMRRSRSAWLLSTASANHG